MKTRSIFAVFLAVILSVLCGCTMFRPITETPETTADHTETVSSVGESTESVPTVQTDAAATEAITEETPPETLPPEPEIRTVSFVGIGDNIVYYGNVRDAASCAVEGGRKYNFTPAYTGVADVIRKADISFINQETLMCGDGYAFSYYPQFNGPQDLGYDLAELGFDVVNIANNHMLDKGEAGLKATIDFWSTLDGVTLLGGYISKDDYAEPRILKVNGIEIAFLSYTFMTNGLSLPSSSALVVPYPDDDTVISQLARARQLADYVIVSVHWGDENVFKPNADQRSFAKLLAENGADAILGHHPHVIQPIEWIDRPDGGKTLCVYSLGNFMAEMARDYNMLGGMISFDIVQCGDTITTENVLFTPTVYYFTTSFYKNHVYLMSEFTDALASSHGLAYYGRTLTIPTLKQYLHSTIDDVFLPDTLRKNPTGKESS